MPTFARMATFCSAAAGVVERGDLREAGMETVGIALRRVDLVERGLRESETAANGGVVAVGIIGVGFRGVDGDQGVVPIVAAEHKDAHQCLVIAGTTGLRQCIHLAQLAYHACAADRRERAEPDLQNVSSRINQHHHISAPRCNRPKTGRDKGPLARALSPRPRWCR